MENKKAKEKGENGLKNIVSDVLGNIKEGASEVGKNTKKAAEDAYESGFELVEDTSDRIQKFTAKQKLESELRKVEKRQEELHSLFGKLTLQHYIKNDNLHKNFLTTKQIDVLAKEYRENLKDIAKINSKIEKL